MELNKKFKWGMVGLIVVSVLIWIWGFFISGFESNGGIATDVLLIWAYAMVAIALIAWIAIGLFINAKNDKSFLKKTGIVLAGIVVICLGAFLLAPANPAVGMLAQPTHGVLKLTDTILNLTYLAGGLAIIAIIVGEIRLSRIKK